MPDIGSMAAAVLLLLQLPTAVVSVSIDVVPTHRSVAPIIADGAAFTVTGYPALQPSGSV